MFLWMFLWNLCLDRKGLRESTCLGYLSSIFQFPACIAPSPLIPCSPEHPLMPVPLKGAIRLMEVMEIRGRAVVGPPNSRVAFVLCCGTLKRENKEASEMNDTELEIRERRL